MCTGAPHFLKASNVSIWLHCCLRHPEIFRAHKMWSFEDVQGSRRQLSVRQELHAKMVGYIQQPR